jgi:hypothetical protein
LLTRRTPQRSRPVRHTNSVCTSSPWPRPLLTLAVASLLCLHCILATVGVIGRSVTSDETGHIVAGYSYWLYGDYRLQPENGNLPQRWGAMPYLLSNSGFDLTNNESDWRRSNVWNIAQKFLFEEGNNSDFQILLSRCWMLAWSIAAGLLVFTWSRSLWGDTAGIAALSLFSFSPTTLAHGALVTSDMCAAVCLLAATGTWWRLCVDSTLNRATCAGLALGVACVAKFSAVLLLPIHLAIWGLVFLVQYKLYHWRDLVKRSALVVLSCIIAVGVIWTSYGFQYSAVNEAVAPFDTFYLSWNEVLSLGGVGSRVIETLREGRILPEAYLYGFSFVTYFSFQRGAFLLGQYSVTGWWWFFPFAFAVKSTIGELVVSALLGGRGFVVLMRRGISGLRDRLNSPLLPLFVFATIYGVFSLVTHLNIGHRHILPLYLVLFIVAGVLFKSGSPTWLRRTAFLGLLIGVGEMWANTPHHLAFFNRLSGGTANGWHLLVDSSFDWGQDVAPLGRWVSQNRIPGEHIYVSCFGTADPTYEGIQGNVLSPYFSRGKERRWVELEAGLYCVSATMLQDVYGIQPGPWTAELEKDFQHLTLVSKVRLADGSWDRVLPLPRRQPEHPLLLLDRLRFARLCQYLKVKRPDAVINHTQFVYRLSKHEIDTFSNQPYSALVALMSAAMGGAATQR